MKTRFMTLLRRPVEITPPSVLVQGSRCTGFLVACAKCHVQICSIPKANKHTCGAWNGPVSRYRKPRIYIRQVQFLLGLPEATRRSLFDLWRTSGFPQPSPEMWDSLLQEYHSLVQKYGKDGKPQSIDLAAGRQFRKEWLAALRRIGWGPKPRPARRC